MNILLIVMLVLALLLLAAICGVLMYLLKRQERLERRLQQEREMSRASLELTRSMASKVDTVSTQSYANFQTAQSMASQVSSITKVMTNAKKRGTWGEYQLDHLVRTCLGDSPFIYSSQYHLQNGKISDGAFHLPGTEQVLCIDSKFPMENYLKMAAEPESAAFFEKELRRNIRKHIMTNAKKRGTWGEYQLDHLVRTCLGDSPFIYSSQYHLQNGKISDGAFHLPGTEQVLCIDSKFPMENYLKMAAEPESAAFFEKELRRNIRKHILDVSEKYITPQTLDTAILFIPNEGLFEYLCSDGADLMSFALEHHVMLVSPTTLAGVVFTLLASTKSFYRAQNLQEIESRMEDLSRKAQTLALQSDKGRKACATLDKTLDDLSRQAWNLVRSMEEISTPDPGQYPGQSEGKTRGSGL